MTTVKGSLAYHVEEIVKHMDKMTTDCLPFYLREHMAEFIREWKGDLQELPASIYDEALENDHGECDGCFFAGYVPGNREEPDEFFCSAKTMFDCPHVEDAGYAGG
jgi:hypothetical protein